MRVIPNEVIFLVMRVLKKVNPGDTYLENYLWHYNKRKESFFDIYHFAWSWALDNHPKKILEIGTRTGISICQLLSAYMDYSGIEKIICCDLFNDGFLSPDLVRLNMRTLLIPEEVIAKTTFLVGDSKVTVAPLIQTDAGTFDYILVDGSHAEADALADLEMAYLLIKHAGVIVFDDITEDGMNLINVWNAFKTKYPEDFYYHEDMNGKGIGWAIKK